jgi:ABC-2 type transport system ATP-binding protein
MGISSWVDDRVRAAVEEMLAEDNLKRIGGAIAESVSHAVTDAADGDQATSSTDRAKAYKSVQVRGISRSFGAVDALRGVTFDIGSGEVVGLLGPNGAGKTTMVDILSTLTRPDRGRASVAGHSVISHPGRVRRSIMLTGQQVAVDDMLTGRENLVLFGRLQGLKKSDARSRAVELLRELDLVDAADRRVGTYSGGMRRRIDIACGLVVRPEVVFLDEPTTGLDPRSRQTIWDLVAGFKSLGIATLLTTQYLEEADALCDRIIVIDHGVIVAEGTPNQLKERAGGVYCEIVPQDLNDLTSIVEALGPLLPEQNREALSTSCDRIAIPAPGGADTLVEALSRINLADIELTDIALRRPSLDDVFLALTQGPGGPPALDGRPGVETRPGIEQIPQRLDALGGQTGAPLTRSHDRAVDVRVASPNGGGKRSHKGIAHHSRGTDVMS